MAEEKTVAGPDDPREQMLQLLNEDLAWEYQALVEINKHIDCLGGEPEAAPKPAKTLNNPIELLRAILDNERKMAEHYHGRVCQAEAMGEFQLSETLRAIIVRAQEIDFNVLPGVHLPPVKTAGSLPGP